MINSPYTRISNSLNQTVGFVRDSIGNEKVVTDIDSREIGTFQEDRRPDTSNGFEKYPKL